MSKSSSAHKNLHITVVGAKELVARKGNLYGEAIVLDTRGEKLGRSRSTRPVRITPSAADPQWDALLAFQVEAKAFSGLMVRLWDKHTFRRDGFLGQVTIKFNTELLDAGDEAPIDQWFALKQRGKKEDVSGSVHLRIHYGDHRAKGKAKGKPARHGEDDGVEEEGDDEEEAKQRPLALSSHYHKDDPRLKKSTFVQVDEDDEDEDYEAHDGLEVAYEPARKGKAELAKLHKDAKATLSAKNFEAANPSSYSAEAVKGLVGVNAGRWYYEVKMISYGQVMVGWCTSSYSKDGQGDAWTFDATNAQTMRKGSYHASFGARCSQNEVIGVGIDVKAKTISYWRNGTPLGEAWTDAALSNKYDRFHPLIDLGRGAHVKVNFGRDPFVHPQTKAGYYALHCALSDSELGALAKLFDEYKAAGIDLTNSADAGDAIQGNGTIKLGEDLGAVDDDDPLMMVLAWKLDCEEKWTISRQEWMDGFALHGCHTLWRIAELAQQWKREVKANAEQFQSFYNFMYPYLLGGGETNKKILEFDVVELVWEVLVKPRGWGLYDEWLAFHREKGTKAVTKDAFQQLYEFMVLYPRDLADYDESAAWPLLFDEFVEWYRAKHPQDD